MTTTLVIGPKTRLGQALRTEAEGPLLAVARDGADVSALTGLGFAAASVIDASTVSLTDRLTADGSAESGAPIRLVIAALGPVHPTEPDYAGDLAGVRRDLDLVDQVLATGRAVEVVLVSTVIALAPVADRRYYGGWKCLLEQLLEQRVAARVAAGGTASLAVLYPGRLRDGGARPWQRIHASYERVARLALPGGVEATPGKQAARTVGFDSRIWLIVRSISFAVRSLGI